MQLFSRLTLGAFLGLAPVAAVPQSAAQIFVAQDDTTGSRVNVSTELPDAPIPHQQPPNISRTVTQQSPSTSGPEQQPPGSTQTQSNSGKGNTTAPSSSPQTPAGQSSSQQSQHEKAEQEVKEQEKQRVGAGGSIFNEFWPDLSRKFLHKDPTHGLDALAQADDRAAKQSKPDRDQKH
jgi:hypothetical protein